MAVAPRGRRTPPLGLEGLGELLPEHRHVHFVRRLLQLEPPGKLGAQLPLDPGAAWKKHLIDLPTPSGWSGNHPDHGLAAGMDVNVLDRDLLLAFAAMAVEGFEQRRIGARQLVSLGEVLAPALEGLFTDQEQQNESGTGIATPMARVVARNAFVARFGLVRPG